MIDNTTLFSFLVICIVVFPLFVKHSMTSSIYFFIVMFIVLSSAILSNNNEGYKRMNYFPWNEANLVVKRIPESTTIDCSWSFVKDGKPFDYTAPAFHLGDPIVAPYQQ